MKTIEKEKNGIFSYELGEYTTVKNVPSGTPYNVFVEMVDYLVEGGDIPQFDTDRNVITNLYSSYILIEYSSDTIRQKDIKNNEKINIESPIRSEVIDRTRQIARNVGEFEYNGKYYLVLYPYNSLTEETSPEKGIFRGVIIDGEKYFEVQNQVSDSNSKVKDVLGDK